MSLCNCADGGGASIGKHSAQSSPWASGAASSSLTGLGTQCVVPLALHSGSHKVGACALAKGAATLTSSTHSQAASTQRADLWRCGDRCLSMCRL